jgi:hypothetical protein
MKIKNKLALWALISASAPAIFWGIWYLIAGTVPFEVESACEGGVIPHPHVPRWWDIIVLPVFSIILFFLNKIIVDPEDRQIQWENLFGGFIFGPIGFVAIPIWGAVYALLRGPRLGMLIGPTYGLVFGLLYGIIFGLVHGLILGLGYGIVTSLFAGLVYGCYYSLRRIGLV